MKSKQYVLKDENGNLVNEESRWSEPKPWIFDDINQAIKEKEYMCKHIQDVTVEVYEQFKSNRLKPGDRVKRKFDPLSR